MADFACSIADAVRRKLAVLTVERSLSQRRGRLYLDCMQNGYGKTIVAPYSPRGIDGAPVSAPLQWSEITPGSTQARFSIRTMPKRLEKLGDLFEPVLHGGITLPPCADLLSGREQAVGAVGAYTVDSSQKPHAGQQSPPQSVHPQASPVPAGASRTDTSHP